MAFEFLPSLFILLVGVMFLFQLWKSGVFIREKLWILKMSILSVFALVAILKESLFLQNGTVLLFILLHVLPLIAQKISARMSVKFRYSASTKAAHVFYFLHPGKSARMFLSSRRFIQDISSGKMTEAVSRPKDHHDVLEVYRYLTYKLISNQWQDILDWTSQRDFDAVDHFIRGASAIFHFRALGELGRYQDMCSLYSKGIKVDRESKLFIFMMMASYFGDKALVKQLSDGPLNGFEADRRNYWEAIATRFEDNKKYRDTMDRLTKAKNLMISQGAKYRISLAEEIKPSGEEIDRVLSDITTVLMALRIPKVKRLPLATYSFIAALFSTWCVQEYLGGSTNPGVLYKMGGVHPELVIAGEYWRIFAANFLHYGSIHLVLNIFGILVFGPLVERSIGHFRFLFLVLALSCLGIGSVMGLAILKLMPGTFVVGASSIIMGLFGFEIGSSIKIWIKTGHNEAKVRLRGWLAGFALQSAVDLLVTQVSIMSHLSGVFWGLLLGLAFQHPKNSQDR
ncbi:MAG: rhomboid family intramembrane serine protease [Proteobacteria bacterium]|nr:rhomboid family intramembrane serine protease [Pseudomonadota bacterium]